MAKKSSTRLVQNTVLTLIFALVSTFLYLQYSHPQETTFATEVTYLRDSGQLLKYDLDVKTLEKVHVVEITDGDTIKVKRANGDEQKVRYIGIDTPEIAHSQNETSEPFGELAKNLNAYLVDSKDVFLRQDATETDKYGRLLRYVYLEDGTMVNYTIVRLGYAVTLTIPPNVLYQKEFSFAQTKARQDKFNLWKE